MSAAQHTGAFRGRKWLDGASYLTAADREAVYRAVRDCKACHPSESRSVGVRPASYIGEPSPFAVVDYGPGRRIFTSVFRSES